MVHTHTHTPQADITQTQMHRDRHTHIHTLRRTDAQTGTRHTDKKHTHTQTQDTDTHTHLLGMAFRIDEVECIRHAKKHQPKRQDETYIYIYIYIITGVNDNIKQQRYTICPPSCDLNAPRGGTIWIKKQVRLHRNIAASSLAADCNVPQQPPAL